jgi:iron complex transport system permease protein
MSQFSNVTRSRLGLDVVTPRRLLLHSSLLALLTLLCILVSLRIGSVDIGYGAILKAAFRMFGIGSASSQENSMTSIILSVRMPRVLLAVIVGGSIAVAGAVFQVFVRNVLADPYILGISGGASVGALVAMTSGLAVFSTAMIPVSAFAGAMLVAAIVFALAGKTHQGDSNSLLLYGVMVGAFLSACILVLVSVSGDPTRSALFWLIGYLGNATASDNLLLWALNVPCLLILWSRSTTLNVYALGSETARYLGIAPRVTFFLLYAAASMVTALSVSVSGAIGFIGLIIPHIARSVFGADHRIMIPACFFLGAIFLVVADLLARTMFAPVELPTGAITAAIGAPLFMYLLKRKKA